MNCKLTLRRQVSRDGRERDGLKSPLCDLRPSFLRKRSGCEGHSSHATPCRPKDDPAKPRSEGCQPLATTAHCLLLFGVVLLFALLLPLSAAAQRLAIRNARLLPVSGVAIENGTILIENGKIRAIGANVAIPAGTQVVDAGGKTIMPGIVDANAHFGLRDTLNEQASEVTPQINILGQLAPRSGDFTHALSYGVTTACLTPDSANVVGGQCGVVKMAGKTPAQMLLKNVAGIRAALGNDTANGNGGFFRAGANTLGSIYLRRPNSRMAAVWELRKALDEAAKSPMLTSVRNGSLPLHVSAHIENDIRAAVTIADEFKIPHLVLDEGSEAYKCADLLAEHKVQVVLTPSADPQTEGPDGSSPIFNTAGLLEAKGVLIAFGSNSNDPAPLLQWASLAVKHGLSPEAALRALTLNAATISGVAERVGSLEVGKDADLLLLSGDPLELTTHIEKVFVNGQVVYRAE